MAQPRCNRKFTPPGCAPTVRLGFPLTRVATEEPWVQDLLHAPLLAIISGILPSPLTPVSSSARLKWRRAIMRCQTSDTLGVGSGPDGGLTGWRPPHVSSQEQLQTTLEPCCGGVVSFLPGLCSLLCCLFPTHTPRSITSSPAPVPLCSSRLLRVQSHYGTDTLNPLAALRVGTHPPKGSPLPSLGARAVSTPRQPLVPPVSPLLLSHFLPQLCSFSSCP